MLHAGGKFDGKAYAVSGGLHGVGVSVVNALSTRVEVEIQKDGFVWTQEYANSKPVAPLAKGEHHPQDRDHGDVLARPQDLRDDRRSTSRRSTGGCRRWRSSTVASRSPCATSGSRTPRPTSEDRKEVTFCYKGGIADFVRHLNQTKTPIHKSVVEFGAEGEGMSVEIAMQWNESYGESVYTFANTINTHEGGTHEEGFRAALTGVVNKYGTRQEVPQGRTRSSPARTSARAWPRSSR